MRITPALVLALPVLGVAAEGVFDQYKAKFQSFLGQFGVASPSSTTEQADPSTAAKPADTPKVKVPPKPIEVLTLDNWKEKLYRPVKADATEPVEWWVLVTGRNKTCWGHCGMAEAAWNKSAAEIATLPNSPHLAYLNCEDNAVLCNAWSAGTPTIWAIKLLPPPATIDIHIKRLSHNTTTHQTIVDLYETAYVAGNKEDWVLNDSMFHPFNGVLTQYGLSVPIAYMLYFFSVVPNWAVMLVVSFISRSMMNRRMAPPARGPGRAPPSGAAR